VNEIFTLVHSSGPSGGAMVRDCITAPRRHGAGPVGNSCAGLIGAHECQVSRSWRAGQKDRYSNLGGLSAQLEPHNDRWAKLTCFVGLALLSPQSSSRGLGPPALVEPSRRAVSFALMFGSPSRTRKIS
jgi:hypothetical protein